MDGKLTLITGVLLLVKFIDGQPIRALLLTGGCWHNYSLHYGELRTAFEREKVQVEWRVISLSCERPDAEISWIPNVDVVLMNGCYERIHPSYVASFAKAIRTKPFVPIHCAMHSFRDAAPKPLALWHNALGIASKQHEHIASYNVRVVAQTSYVLAPMIRARIVRDELYVVENVLPRTRVLAYSSSQVTGQEHPVFWKRMADSTGSSVFGTTFGHSDETWQDKNFMATLVRGTLWACGKLRDSALNQ